MQATHYEHVQDKDSVIETRFEYDITKLIKTWHYIYITWTFFYAKWVIMIKGVKVSQLQLLLISIGKKSQLIESNNLHFLWI